MTRLLQSAVRNFGAGAASVAALFGVAGCNNDSNPMPIPQVCICPVKIHGSAPCACGGVGCTCKQKEYNNLINFPNATAVDETSQGLVTDSFITTLDGYFSLYYANSDFIDLKSGGSNYKIVIKDNLLGGANCYLSKDDNYKIIVKFGAINSGAIGEIINTFTDGSPTEDDFAMLPNKNTIRLANGRTLNVGSAGVPGAILCSVRG